MEKFRSMLSLAFCLLLMGCTNQNVFSTTNQTSHAVPSYQEKKLAHLACKTADMEDITCINAFFADNWLAHQKRNFLTQAVQASVNPTTMPTNISLQTWQYRNWQVVDLRLFWMKYFSSPTWYNDQRIFDPATQNIVKVYDTLSPVMQRRLIQDLENAVRQEMQNVIDGKSLNSSVQKSLNITVNVPHSPISQRQWLDKHIPIMLNQVALLKRDDTILLNFCSSHYGITNLTQFEPCVTLPAQDYLE